MTRIGTIPYVHGLTISNTLAVPDKAELPFILISIVHPVRVNMDLEGIFNHVCTVSKSGAREITEGVKLIFNNFSKARVQEIDGRML